MNQNQAPLQQNKLLLTDRILKVTGFNSLKTVTDAL
jgi:hypothetical protein